MNTLKLTLAALTLSAGSAFAAGHATPAVTGSDQDVSGGTVAAESIVAAANGWLVVHRTDADMKPGPVIGHAPVRAGETMDVVAILTEEVKSGEMLMLMLHGDDGVAIKADEIAWLRANVTNLEVVDLGPGKHFLQETHPHEIGTSISRWFAKL